jgi:hypothetical protein
LKKKKRLAAVAVYQIVDIIPRRLGAAGVDLTSPIIKALRMSACSFRSFIFTDRASVFTHITTQYDL